MSESTPVTSYCSYIRSGRAHPVHVAYHDDDYGRPIEDEGLLFERLILEINQAGLSWEMILKKRDTFRVAYANYDVDAIAAFGPDDVTRLLADPGIIRNRLKVQAAIHNAQQVIALRAQGGFGAWLRAHHPRDKQEWVKLFKKTFRFTGGEIVNEFLVSLGYLPGAHDPDCEVAARIAPYLP